LRKFKQKNIFSNKASSQLNIDASRNN